MGTSKNLTAMATAQNIALAHSLPPRLLNFFKRFPPPQLSAASTTTSKPARETITVTENTSSSDPNAGASQVEVPLPSETRRKAMETMPDMINLWRERGHGRGWKKYPSGKEGKGTADLFNPEMRHAWVHERAPTSSA